MKNLIKQIFLIIVSGIIFTECSPTSPELQAPTEDDHYIMKDGLIVKSSNCGMGIDDSEKLRNWMFSDSTKLSIHYPGNLNWGAVFITLGGDPVNKPRPYCNFSHYNKLLIEMKSTVVGSSVDIGIKD
jgi:hypothetical protein